MKPPFKQANTRNTCANGPPHLGEQATSSISSVSSSRSPATGVEQRSSPVAVRDDGDNLQERSRRHAQRPGSARSTRNRQKGLFARSIFDEALARGDETKPMNGPMDQMNEPIYGPMDQTGVPVVGIRERATRRSDVGGEKHGIQTLSSTLAKACRCKVIGHLSLPASSARTRRARWVSLGGGRIRPTWYPPLRAVCRRRILKRRTPRT